MDKGIKVCKKCKTLNSSKAKFCRNCGETIDEIPEIHDFSLISSCHIGDIIKLSWKVSNADIVSINDQDVSSLRFLELEVNEPTKFRLCA